MTTNKLFVEAVAIVIAITVGVVYFHSVLYPKDIHSIFSVMNAHKNNNPASHSITYHPIPSISYFITINKNLTEMPRQHLPPSNATGDPQYLPPAAPPEKIKEDNLNTSGRMQRSYSKLERLEEGLRQARAAIREGSGGKGSNTEQDPDYVPSGSVYWNATAFHRSFMEMEKRFKVYIYEEGDPPIFHSAPPTGVLGMEGIFLNEIEVSHFRTRDPHQAHVYFLPISIVSIVHYVFVRGAYDRWTNMRNTALDYVNLIAHKHPYWNRSLGADHVMLACHDWAPEISFSIPNLYNNSIRALCNANTTEKFRPIKDVSIPEIYLPHGTTEGLLNGTSPSLRTTFVFFAGGIHGYIRQVLFEHWENKDKDIQIQQYLPRKGESYYDRLRNSKFCICPSGYEVADARIFEALYTGCVPVLIKAHYVAPFSDVLNWKSFSVDIPVEDIPKLKQILMGISDKQYIKMQQRGLKVRRHFEVNFPPKRYDVFHMILHSIWLRRLNLQIRDHEEL